MIWYDEEDDVDGACGELLDGASEPAPAHGDDSGWHPLPKPPLYPGPFEIIAEYCDVTDGVLTWRQSGVLVLASNMARAAQVCARLNRRCAVEGSRVRYVYRAPAMREEATA